MDKQFNGTFSLGLSSLQFQVKSLFDEAGGEKACQLLDILSSLNQEAREKALGLFIELAGKLRDYQHSLPSLASNGSRDFETRLYNTLIADLNATPHLALVSGGRANKQLIDLGKARAKRSKG